MDDTVLKITLAAFLHDIGKFAEGGMELLPGFEDGNAGLYLPQFNNEYTHRHALYTAAFIDHIEKLLPAVFNKANWGLDDPFMNLAAGHHKPETPLQWIIAMADRLSSGMDRIEFDEYNKSIAWQNYRKTRLLPLFEHLGKDVYPTMRDKYCWCYPLKEISAANIFPERRETHEPDENAIARNEYKRLFDEFIFALEKLKHRKESVTLWLEHLDSLLLIFTSTIPAARAGNIVPDVALYDHSRITAALASALYIHHKETGTLNITSVQDDKPSKFLLIGGDSYGIQDFIFSDGGETGKARSKILRGRSFAVSLFSELAADMLCREIGLSSLSVVLNAAGKFTIIAPNTPRIKEVIGKVEKEINAWFMKTTYGDSSFGIGWVEACPADFTGDRFTALWEKTGQSMERRKFTKIDMDRYGGAVPGYLDEFHNELKRPLCPFCGKRPSSPEVEGKPILGDAQSACTLCHDHIFLGEKIVKKDQLAILQADAQIHDKGNSLSEPIFGRYQVAFLDGGLNELARQGALLKHWDISIQKDGSVQKNITARFMKGYVPLVSEADLHDDRILSDEKSEGRTLEDIEGLELGNLMTFGHIAAKARNQTDEGLFQGIQALGVLKADVDQLGMLMAAGIPPGMFSISRLAALSRQLDFFFCVYLPHLLKTDSRFQDIYTVFAGGDDLFLIGPWNRIIDLSLHLRKAFAWYVCANPEIHFSAGITLHKPGTPLRRLAEAAEEALAHAKVADRNRITLFGQTATWDEFAKISSIKEQLLSWWDGGLVNKAMAYRLNDFIDRAQQARQVLAKGEADLHNMESLKWRALFSYSTERNIGKGLPAEDRRARIKEFAQAARWLEEHGSCLKMALWDVIYNKRYGG